MKIIVQNSTVSRNIDLFKKVAQNLSRHKEIHQILQGKGLSGFVNCLTGELYFGEMVEENPQNWKAIFLSLAQTEDFLVVGVEGVQFRVGDFSPPAYQTMLDTIRILNLTFKLLQSKLDLDGLLRILDQMEFTLSKDLVHDAWHQVDRIGAERLLYKQIPGTFLFRKDEYAALLEQQLTEQLATPIKCITLTYLDKKARVVDFTLVKRAGSWIFYNDDPCLEGAAKPEVFALLGDLGDAITLPLLSC